MSGIDLTDLKELFDKLKATDLKEAKVGVVRDWKKFWIIVAILIAFLGTV